MVVLMLFANNSISNNSAAIFENQSSLVPAWIIYSTTLQVWVAIIGILAIIGTSLNVPLFVTIATGSKLNTGSGALIAHLLFIESMLCSVWNPIICISMYTAHIKPLSHTFCQYALFGYYIFLHCANWSTLLLAINRFVAIMFPHQYSKVSSKPALLFSMSFGWMVAIGFNLPGFLGVSGDYVPIPPWGGCGTKVTAQFAWFNALLTGVLTSIPVSGVGLAYIVMFVKIGVVWCRNRNAVVTKQKDDSSAGARHDRSVLQKRRFDSAKMLFISYLWYSLCYLPAPIASSVYPQAYASMPALQLALRGVLLMGYAFNPVIYIAMNSEYRKRLFKLLHITGDHFTSHPTRTATVAKSQVDSAWTGRD
ncbi:rhodopsin-like [Paramacrobiotus metropolitanus]|uniref:rhodopsin-like n=1 Tax=Paramacrobiotus metropolitanus TaxID=2943436 RepID=UPI002446208A|nr:rhodopsin-like [Paramacrobiotus metropolitanus]